MSWTPHTGGWTTIGGGWYNTASGNYAAVGGGISNTASYSYTAVSGGYNNTADDQCATVGGGRHNTASASDATVCGGYDNVASGIHSVVGGGVDNVASGIRATIPGGESNVAASSWSFAAGRQAKAYQYGCFVWGDSTDAYITCNDPDRWVARASGGVYFHTNAGLSSGMYLAAGGSSWNAVSSRALKDNLALVDTGQLLERLARIDIGTWNYRSQDPAIRHIGPMAEDFNGLVDGLGGQGADHINTLDADGVALAAIQGLYDENQALKAKNAAQQEQINDLAARLSALEQAGGRPAQGRSALSLIWPLAVGLVVAGGGTAAARRRPGGGR
jgi:hypothetical protein